MYESILSHPDGLFRQFDQWRRELEDVFGTPGLPNSIRSVAPGSWPAINLGRTKDSVEIYAFAPGLDASKIDVTIDRGVLRITGERAPAGPEKGSGASFYTRERGAGKFTRAVALPDDVDPAQVNASYREGVLKVSVGRREAMQPKRVTVQ
jgi:HSP20 family protein